MATGLESWVSNPDETHGPLISITSWALCGVAAGFLLLRLSIRQNQGKLWLDDCVLGISWVLLLIQVTINQLAVNLGLGKHSLDIDFSHFDRIAYYGACGLSISVVATTLSKISFGVTLLRLTDNWLKIYVYFAIATLAIFAIPAAVLPWVLCRPVAKAFVDIIPGTCIDKEPSVQYARFQAVWSALMDISLALLPWRVLWKLQMRLAEKIGVGIAMSLGVLAGAAAIIRGRYVEQLTKQDLSYDAVNAMIWAVAETSMTVVATSIPVLRVFFKHAVQSAIETYQNSSSRSKSRTSPSIAPSTANASLQRSAKRMSVVVAGKHTSSKRRTGAADNYSGGSISDVLGRGSKGYLEMDDLVIDEETGRVTASTTKSLSEGGESYTPHQPV